MYLRIRAGLLEPKHVQAMDQAVWLYLYLHANVRFTGEGAGTWHGKEPYHHEAAAEALGVSVRHVKRWFDTLRTGGYVSATRLQRGLRVEITKYGAAPRSDKSVTSQPTRSDISVTSEVPDVSLQTTKSVTSQRPPTRSARENIDKSSSRDIHPLLTERDATAARIAPRPVPKPNRYGEVIDAIRATGLTYSPTDRDAKAVKLCPLEAGDIASCYRAIAAGEFGDDFMRRRLSVETAIGAFNAYQAFLLKPDAGRGAPKTMTQYAMNRLRQRRSQDAADDARPRGDYRLALRQLPAAGG